MVFNVAVLDSGGVVPALHPDQARLLDGGLIVASADICVLQNIAGAVLVDLWGIRLHGLLHVQNEGQLLILHLQRPDGLSGSYLVLRDDGPPRPGGRDLWTRGVPLWESGNRAR